MIIENNTQLCKYLGLSQKTVKHLQNINLVPKFQIDMDKVDAYKLHLEKCREEHKKLKWKKP